MKYCVRFSRDFHYLDKDNVGEFLIKYKPNENKLVAFLDKYAEKRIIISIDEKDMQNLVLDKKIKEIYATRENMNFAFQLPSINQENEKTITLFIDVLKDYNIPFFFVDKIYSLDKLWELIRMGVSDVYVCGELGFSLRDISEKIHKADVKIRVYPDVAQSTAATENSVTSFYIRPEDANLYEDIVDVFEFFVDDSIIDNLHYVIYNKKKWTGPIGEIIYNFDGDYSNDNLPKHFGIIRTNCGKRCLKNGSCNLCQSSLDLSNKLAENGLLLKEIIEG